MTEDVLFGEEDLEPETDLETGQEEIYQEVKDLRKRVTELENAVLPSIRKVMTDNGPRFIIEQGTERWYKPETLKARLKGDE